MPTRLEPERPLGATGITVPLIGYGTAPLGKKDVSREHAVRCLNEAIDRGVTYLDTSPDYGREPHVGEVMRRRRAEVFLATRIIGITGHARPELLGHALTRYRFDTVLCALGMADRLVTSPETFLFWLHDTTVMGWSQKDEPSLVGY